MNEPPISYLIPIGDGRVVKHTEGVLTNPPPPPPPGYHGGKPRRPRAHKSKQPSFSKPNKVGEWQALAARFEGYREYRQYKLAMFLRYKKKSRFKGQVDGYNHVQLAELKKKASKQVKKDMENIKKVVDVNEMAEEALVGALKVLREPASQQAKLQAARLILDFTKSKPAAKSEVSVASAENWLASLDTNDEAL